MIQAVLASRDSVDPEMRKGRKHRMQTASRNRTSALCSCGKVELEAEGDPIVSTVCYCESCQEGSRQIEALPNGRRVCGPDGGTAYVLYRKDRIEYPRGSELLRGFKLEDESSTRRVVAACCGSPMFLDFEKGHWLTVYRTALRGDLPPTEMRVQTKSKPEGVDLPDDVPNHKGYSIKFMAKLFGAWIPMLLRR
jgi:hypothetical protein